MARLTYTDVSPILKQMYEQYTGRAVAGNIDFGTMQSVFKTGISNNDDNLYNAIPTVLARTVVASRPYRRKFKGMFWDAQKFGDWVRKFTPIVSNQRRTDDQWNIDVELQKDASAQDWKAGTAPVKFDFLLTFVEGGNSYSVKYTLFRNQLNAAFENAQSLADFISGQLQELSNQYEIDAENEARSQISNIILTLADAGKSVPTVGNACNKVQCWHALTEFNAETGLGLTYETVMQPAAFREFMIWFSSRLDVLKDKLTVHSSVYHGNVDGKVVNRHTDSSKLRFYVLTEFASYFRNNGAALYNPQDARISDYEETSFWQSITDSATVMGSAKCLKNDGTELTIPNATVEHVVGLLTDIDMFGITPIDTWAEAEPANARYGFRNYWNHYTWRQNTDFTENAVLIVMD